MEMEVICLEVGLMLIRVGFIDCEPPELNSIGVSWGGFTIGES